MGGWIKSDNGGRLINVDRVMYVIYDSNLSILDENDKPRATLEVVFGERESIRFYGEPADKMYAKLLLASGLSAG